MSAILVQAKIAPLLTIPTTTTTTTKKMATKSTQPIKPEYVVNLYRIHEQATTAPGPRSGGTEKEIPHDGRGRRRHPA